MLRIVFLSYIAVVVAKIVWSERVPSRPKPEPSEAVLPSLLVTVPYFAATGAVGTILGIGGALLTIPIF